MYQNNSNDICLFISLVKHNFFQSYSINVYNVERSDKMRFRTKNSIVIAYSPPENFQKLTNHISMNGMHFRTDLFDSKC